MPPADFKTLAGPHPPMLSGGLAPVQEAVRAAEYDTAHERSFMTMIVPGLLQTPGYIRGAWAGLDVYGDGAVSDLDEAVTARLRRQEVLSEPGHSWHNVLLEQVLWTPMGSLDSWGEQLARLAEVARGAVPSYRLGVVPRGTVWTGKQPNMSHQFHIHDDREASLELPHAYLVVTDPADITFFVSAFDCAARHAVYGEDAAQIIESAAAEMGVG